MKKYKFDPSCTNPDNIVVRERYTIEPPQTSNFYFVIPKSAPFFAGRDFKITHYPSGRELQPGTDYVPSNRFIAATRSTGLGVYGSITLLNHTLSGILEITYHTIGGIWTFDEQSILEYLTRVERDPRITSWDSVLDQPAVFPPTLHDFDINDLKGWEVMMPGLEAIREAIDAKGAGIIEDHMNDFGNPHRVDKYQVGLGFVMNYPISTLAEAVNAVVNTSYLTPLRARNLVEELAIKPLMTHTSNGENPHQTTKGQVGLGLVENFPLATLQDLATMSSNAAYMTPLRVGEAQTNFYNAYLKPHLEDTNNPHGVTKAQVGLGSVHNFPMATDTLALQGVSRNHYMSPGLVDLFVREKAIEPFLLHLRDLNNPHGVTKSQVGLSQVPNYREASDNEAIEMLSRTTLMTPHLTRLAVQEFMGTGEGGVTLGSHVMNHSNPHGVTKAQVGLGAVENLPMATDALALQGLSRTHYMSPGLVDLFVREKAIEPFLLHLRDLNNPHGVTKAQVGLSQVPNYREASDNEAIEMLSRTTLMTPHLTRLAVQEFMGTGEGGVTLGSHVMNHSNPHRVTAAQVGTLTTEQITALLADKLYTTATAVNSQRFDSMTPPEFIEYVRTNLDLDIVASMTPEQILELSNLVLRGKADESFDSDKLEGKTLDEVIFLANRAGGIVPQILEFPAVEFSGTGNHHFLVGDVEERRGVTEVTLLVSGGVIADGSRKSTPPLALIRIDFEDKLTTKPHMTIQYLTGHKTDVDFWLSDLLDENGLDEGIQVWARTDTGMSPLTITNLTPKWFILTEPVIPEASSEMAATLPTSGTTINDMEEEIPITYVHTPVNVVYDPFHTRYLNADSTIRPATIPTLNQSTTGRAATAGVAEQATRLVTGRTIAMTGDVTWTSAAFTGAGNVTGVATLAASGVTAGTYGKVTVDAKGRVTAGMALAAGDIPTLNQNTTGNAGSATKLQTARTIGLSGDASGGVSFDGSGNVLIPVTLTGKAPTAGAADTAVRLATGRTIAMTGDVTWTSASFTGAGNVTGVATLANSGVVAGTYGKVTVDAKGRVTAGAALAAGDIPNLDAAKVTSGVFSVARIPVTNHSTTGNAATATRLQTGRTIAMTGDVTWTSAAFTGAGNVTGVATLAASGVTAGTYGKVTVDAKGRVTAGMALAAGDIPNLPASKVTSGTFAAARIPTLNQNTTGSAGSLSSGTRTLTPITTQNGGFRMANGTYNLDMYSMPWTPPTRTPPYEGMGIRSVHCFDTTSEGYKFNKVMFTTNLVATSDRRLKRNIRPIEDALTRLRLLNGVIYSMDGNPDAGLLADDVERALPEATVMIPHDELPDAMGVKYNAVVGLLVEAAKGLDQQLSVSEAKRGVLESRVEDLEARLERLESLLAQDQGSV